VSSNSLATFLPLVLIVLVFWFLVIRPTRKRQQQVSAVQSSLGPGSHVMLSSGIFGTVVSVADESVRVEIAQGTTIKVARQAEVRVVEDAVTDTVTPTPEESTPDQPTTGTDDGPAPAGSTDSSDEH
jgi:preprotein translocase subunit YajC